MISICVKSLNKKYLNTIEQHLDNLEFENILYSQKKFKHFYNIIIHYTGTKIKKFYTLLNNIIAEAIIENFEKILITKQFEYDFFYFSQKERKQIMLFLENSLNIPTNFNTKKDLLISALQNYFESNNICNIDGFINFRIADYKHYINLILEKEINNYVLNKEYCEYVDLLKNYIATQNTQTDLVHLIYSDTTKMLLDNSKEIITNDENLKYISDITFSSNDFILNSLLSYLPEKIIIHLNTEEDNFIRFLKLIFTDKIIFCTNCEICNSQYVHIKK